MKTACRPRVSNFLQQGRDSYNFFKTFSLDHTLSGSGGKSHKMAHINRFFRFMLCIAFTLSNNNLAQHIIKFTGYMRSRNEILSNSGESSKIHNGFNTAGSRFQTRQSSLSHTCLIGFKSGNKLSRGRLAMFC